MIMIRRRFHDNQTVQNTNRHISLSNLPDIEVANIMTMDDVHDCIFVLSLTRLRPRMRRKESMFEYDCDMN